MALRHGYGGRAPKVLDPFAGGGAIPLEAMRHGCEATAIDINPVAWFILKCTLEYPQKLAGQKRPLPEFILGNRNFVERFFKAQGIKGAALRERLEELGHAVADPQRSLNLKDDTETRRHGDAASSDVPASWIEADLAWHVRAWGQWVLDRARRDLAQFYPTYADFEPLKKSDQTYEARPMQLVPLTEDGTPDIDRLNAEFTADCLADARNPRWVAKPTVAYLWARTVKCKNCRATIPLLKTRWLCKTARKRVLLTMQPNETSSGVVFGIETDVPVRGGNAAQRRESDKKLGAGTMSRAGAQCPCCPTIMSMEDIRLEGQNDRLSAHLTVVAVEGQGGKEYRLPTRDETSAAIEAQTCLERIFSQIPGGLPTEATPRGGGSGAARAFSLWGYGLREWRKLFTDRQLLALGTLVVHTRAAREAALAVGYSGDWEESLCAYLTCGVDRLVDFANVNTQWKVDADTINHALVRFAIQITWDFAEGNPIGSSAGSYELCQNRIATGMDSILHLPQGSPSPLVIRASATQQVPKCDLVVTDPPYYDAIPYSDLMDWFYVWLRRGMGDFDPSYAAAMKDALGPKWSRDDNDGELIDDETRHCNDAVASKKVYEEGMARCFGRCREALSADGRLVIVFANKQPEAWETLVGAVIRAGFVVTGSWPIQTEQPSRTRGLASAALASSVWLIAKNRSEAARPGWDNKVLEEMRANIAQQLRNFWDAGIRGPDFVWAATGPALEAYSKHPVVKKADEPGQVMSVSEFLHHVRRIVVDFVVGRVLSGDGEADMAAADRLDDVTAYYLLHRHDFGFTDAPVGGCILYAISCGLSDSELADTWDILSRTGGSANEEEEEETDPDAEPEAEESSGSKVKLKTWAQRNRKNMGYEAPGGRPVPLIDRLHRLMHLWRAGEVAKVDEYLDNHGLRRHELFRRLLQSLVELSPTGSDERATLESISNHVGAKGAKPSETMPLPGMESDAESEDQ